jgi:hypothetical protein
MNPDELRAPPAPPKDSYRAALQTLKTPPELSAGLAG